MFSKAIVKRRELLRMLGSASFLGAPVFGQAIKEARAADIPVRFVAIYLPGGATAGKFNFANVLAPLAPFKADAIEFTKMNNGAAESIWGITGEPHAAALRTLLTGDSSVKPEENASVFAKSDSIDQMIGAKNSAQLKFTTLQFGVVTETKSNPLDQRRMSFKGGVPQPPVESPTEMFGRMFGNAAPTSPAPTTMVSPTPPVMNADASADNKSMLDLLSGEITALQRIAGRYEQQKLDQHLTSLRELEKQIVGSTSGGGSGSTGNTTVDGSKPAPSCGPPKINQVCSAQNCVPDIATVTRQQFSLLHQALVCDMTRAASMQLLGTAHTEVGFKWLGVPDDHHALEHNQVSGSGPSLDKVQTFFAGEIANFLGLLKDTKEGTGTMLDNSVVAFFSDFRDAGSHSHDDFPAFVFGRGGGKVKPGRTIDYADSAHNLWLRSLINVFGIDKQVGDAQDGTPISLG